MSSRMTNAGKASFRNEQERIEVQILDQLRPSPHVIVGLGSRRRKEDIRDWPTRDKVVTTMLDTIISPRGPTRTLASWSEFVYTAVHLPVLLMICAMGDLISFSIAMAGVAAPWTESSGDSDKTALTERADQSGYKESNYLAINEYDPPVMNRKR